MALVGRQSDAAGDEQDENEQQLGPRGGRGGLRAGLEPGVGRYGQRGGTDPIPSRCRLADKALHHGLARPIHFVLLGEFTEWPPSSSPVGVPVSISRREQVRR